MNGCRGSWGFACVIVSLSLFYFWSENVAVPLIMSSYLYIVLEFFLIIAAATVAYSPCTCTPYVYGSQVIR